MSNTELEYELSPEEKEAAIIEALKHFGFIWHARISTAASITEAAVRFI